MIQGILFLQAQIKIVLTAVFRIVLLLLLHVLPQRASPQSFPLLGTVPEPQFYVSFTTFHLYILVVSFFLSHVLLLFSVSLFLYT